MPHLFVAVLVGFAVLFACNSAQAAKRVALVIGNAAYEKTSVLKNPGNDANALSTVLEKLGFQVIKGVDLKRSAFEAKAREFALAARGAEVALFFYAGHGLQVHGRNYLVPTDAQLADEADLDFQTVSLDTILRNMEREQRTNLVFLDACRDNPLARNLARSMGTRSSAIGRGLAKVEGGIGTLIAFATQPGNVALDGKENNSPFTTALLNHIEKPGLDIAQLMRRVRKDVIAQTSNRQVPWSNSSLTGDFYFSGRITIGPAKPQTDSNELSALKDRLKELEERLKKQSDQKPKPKKDETDIAIGVFPEQDKPTMTLKYKPSDVFEDCEDCPKMIVVPAGSFMMGDNLPPDPLAGAKSEPVHKVSISRPFAVGKFEVTRGSFQKFVNATKYKMGPCRTMSSSKNPFLLWEWPESREYSYFRPGFRQTDTHPVICVSWNDAQNYVAWISKQAGKTYRLLSEAEWEYTARAGTTTKYWWGQSYSKATAHYGGMKVVGEDPRLYIPDANGPTVPVTSFQPNKWGLYNMQGNASEWVEDCFHETYKGAPIDGRAWTSGDCKNRMHRGQTRFSQDDGPPASAKRGSAGRDTRLHWIGFRVARDLTPEELGEIKKSGKSEKSETKVAVGVLPKGQETTADKNLNACDRLAADPMDAQAKAPGVKDWQIDKEAALEACLSAVDKFSKEWRYTYQLGRVRERWKDYGRAARLYRKAAEANYVRAMYAYGALHAYGFGVPQSYPEYFKWKKKAADLGDIEALGEVAYAYENGLGISRDQAKSEEYWKRYFDAQKKLADTGNVAAMWSVAGRYSSGIRVAKDEGSALIYTQRAADQGHLAALRSLGHSYAFGSNGISKNKEKSQSFYQRAVELAQKRSENGDVDAKLFLADAHTSGTLVEKDISKARAIYEDLINSGYDEALNLLALNYDYHEPKIPGRSTALNARMAVAKNCKWGAVRAARMLHKSSQPLATPEAAAKCILKELAGATVALELLYTNSIKEVYAPTRRELQRLLKEKKFYRGPVDGNFDEVSFQALKEYSKATKLKPDEAINAWASSLGDQLAKDALSIPDAITPATQKDTPEKEPAKLAPVDEEAERKKTMGAFHRVLGELNGLKSKNYGVALEEFRTALGFGDAKSGFQIAKMYKRRQNKKISSVEAAQSMAFALKNKHYDAFKELQANASEWPRQFQIELQKIIRESGDYSGPVDGKIGPGTLAAIKSYSGKSNDW